MSASVLHPQVHPENDLAIASSQVWNLPRDYSFERSHACLKLNQGYFRGCLPSHPDVNLRSTWPNRSDDLSPISIRAPENFKEEAPSHCVELSAFHMVYENGRAPWRKLGGCCGNSEKAGWLRRKLYRDTILYRTRRPSQSGGTIQHGPNLRLVFHNLDPGGASAHSDPRPLSALATPSQERQSIAIRDDMTGIDEHEDAHLKKTITPCSRCGSPLPPTCAVPTATRVPPGTAAPLSRMHERAKDAIDAGDMEGKRGRR